MRVDEGATGGDEKNDLYRFEGNEDEVKAAVWRVFARDDRVGPADEVREQPERLKDEHRDNDEKHEYRRFERRPRDRESCDN